MEKKHFVKIVQSLATVLFKEALYLYTLYLHTNYIYIYILCI